MEDLMNELIKRAKLVLDFYAQKILERKNAERAYKLDAVTQYCAANNAASVLLPPCAAFVLTPEGFTDIVYWERGGSPAYYYDDDGIPRAKK